MENPLNNLIKTTKQQFPDITYSYFPQSFLKIQTPTIIISIPNFIKKQQHIINNIFSPFLKKHYPYILHPTKKSIFIIIIPNIYK
jgi:hypothetical protein